MHQGHRGAGVGVEVFDGIHGQLRVDHDHHRANFECAEQRRHKLRPVGERDDHPLLRLDAGTFQQVTKTIRERLDLTVGQRAVIGQERRAVALPLTDTRIQEPIGDVELLR